MSRSEARTTLAFRRAQARSAPSYLLPATEHWALQALEALATAMQTARHNTGWYVSWIQRKSEAGGFMGWGTHGGWVAGVAKRVGGPHRQLLPPPPPVSPALKLPPPSCLNALHSHTV